MASDDWTQKPYAGWLEFSIKELMDANPVAIAMEMVDEYGLVSTCYYNTSPNDRACMIDAMRDDSREMWLRDNRDMIMTILNGDDDDIDGLQEDDPAPDSEDG
jgi:hypothetical protein